MAITTRLAWALSMLFIVAALLPAADDGLSKVELAKLGKQATALVDFKARKSSGSAFCVHPTGLFITNEHVAGPEGTKGLKVVLYPGTASQKVLDAQVVRADKELDLALLRVEGVKDLPVLKLGADEKLTELLELVAFGFPFGNALSFEKGQYPAISVNLSSVTALRLKNGALQRIQLDGALNPGNSGGPLLDKKGEVVGVVVSGVVGAGVNFAIPASQVKAFVARPELSFTPPAVMPAKLHVPATFEARAQTVLPSAKPLTLELILRTDDGKERKLPMVAAADGSYRVTAAPLPKSDGPQLVRASITFPSGSVTGLVADRSLKVGTKTVPLADVRSFQVQPQPQLLLADGTRLDKVTGLETLDIQLGKDSKETIRLTLASALNVVFEPLVSGNSVSWTLTARAEGVEAGRLTGTIGSNDASKPSGSTPSTIQAPKLAEDKVVYELPSTFSDLTVGGGGRYFIFWLPKLRKLAIFDVSVAKIVHSISIAEDNIKFAAGEDKLLVGLPAARVLQRWSLKTFEREAAVPLPIKEDLKCVAMGCSSSGPVLVNWDLIDVATLKPLPWKWTQHPGQFPDLARIRFAANGTVFVRWQENTGGPNLYVIAGNEVKAVPFHNGHQVVSHVHPGPSGKFLFTSNGPWTNEPKPMEGGKLLKRFCIPSYQGDYYLNVRILDQEMLSPNDKREGVGVYMATDSRPIVMLPHVDVYYDGINGWGREPFDVERRVHFIPDAKLIVNLPISNDRLVLYRFDVEAALDKSGLDYLLVTSEPPSVARRGSVYTYPVTVKSKKGGVRYRLESGPAGMKISPTGQLTWAVPADLMGEINVVVSVADGGGQEVFHSFKLRPGN